MMRSIGFAPTHKRRHKCRTQKRRSAVRQEHRQRGGKPLVLRIHGESMAPAAQEYPQHPIPTPEGSTDTRSRRAAAEFSGRVHRVVGASFVSFASALARKLIRYAAPPLQITTASLGRDLRMTKGLIYLCGFILTPQFHYGDRNKGSRQIPYSIKGSVAHKPVD